MDAYKGSTTGGHSSQMFDKELAFCKDLTVTNTGKIGDIVNIGTGFVDCNVVVDVASIVGSNTIKVEGSRTIDFDNTVTLAALAVVVGRTIVPIRNAMNNEEPYPYIRINATMDTSGSADMTVFMSPK